MKQRQIAFRAWHKEKKQMIEGSLLFWFKAIAKSGKGESVFDACEWMQFTGIKDSKGVEIYEGDIVKNGYGTIVEVRWADKPFNDEERKGITGWKPFCTGWANYIGSLHFEVIGNVFENEGLLK